MNPDPDLAGDYGTREAGAVRRVLLELGQILGAYRDAFVVVGGSVPWLLLTDAEPAHVGTLDIDLDLDPNRLEDGQYADLVQLLEAKGYQRLTDGLRPFQMRRMVKVDQGPEVAVMLDLLMPAGLGIKKRRPPLIQGLRVQQVDGGSLPLRNNQLLTLEDTMPDGRANRVELRIATIPAFLVMKGYALVGRDKKKDAYDIYYSVRNYPGGLAELARACQPLLSDEEALQGYRHIASKFNQVSDFGPITVRRFLEESNATGGMSGDQLQQDAFQQVAAWLGDLGLLHEP